MIKRLALFLFILLSALSVSAQESETQSWSIPHQKGNIMVDGELREWLEWTPMELMSDGLVRGGARNGENDLSAFVWLSWDDSGLFIAADTRDDEFLGIPSGRQIWNSDALVLILQFPQVDSDGQVYYVMLSSKDSNPEVAVLKGKGTAFNMVECSGLFSAVHEREGTGPRYEAYLPWQDLLGTPAAPQQMDFNVEVRDFDTGKGVKSICWIPATPTAGGAYQLCQAFFRQDSQTNSGYQSAIRELVQLVQIPVVVTDGDNEYVKDLMQDDFLVEEDGIEQTVIDLKFETRPITLGLMIDSSGSMLRDLEDVKNAACNFLDVLREEDRAFVISFSHNVELLKDFEGGVEEAKEAIDSIEAEGGTMLYASLQYALEKLQYLREKKVIILLSDGRDESFGATGPYAQETTLNMVLEEARRNEVSVYAIAFRVTDPDAIQDLNMITRETGGRLYGARDVGSLLKAYQEIAEELKSQYLVTYKSSNDNKDGLWRDVTIDVRDRRVQVRARKGYFAEKR